jgi:hypothetical protein
MNKIPRHLLAFGILFLLAGAGGGAAWYWSHTQLAEAQQRRADLEGKINRLITSGYYPTPQNLEQLRQNTRLLEERFTPVVARMAVSAAELDDVRGTRTEKGSSGLSGDEWKKRLAAERDALLQRAQAQGVTVPEDFYLGFKSYRARVPEQAHTYELGLQLRGLSTLCGILLESGVSGVREAKRVLMESSGPATGDEALNAANADGFHGNYRMYPLEVRFRGPPGCVREVLNRIAGSKLFYVIRFVELRNDKTEAPKKSEVVRAGVGTAAAGGQAPLIRTVLGQEQVEVRLRVDLIDWKGGGAAAAQP